MIAVANGQQSRCRCGNLLLTVSDIRCTRCEFEVRLAAAIEAYIRFKQNIPGRSPEQVQQRKRVKVNRYRCEHYETVGRKQRLEYESLDGLVKRKLCLDCYFKELGQIED